MKQWENIYESSEADQHLSELISSHTSDLKAAEEPKQFLI